MPIKVWDYLNELAQERAEIQDAMEEVLKSGQLILGPHVQHFEAAFARYCGCTFGVGVNSGTDALFLALKALELKAGDEVITVANTAVPTIAAIIGAGGKPKFVDIDPQTYLLDVKQLDRAATSRSRCILPVHLFGQCVDMNGVREFAKTKKISILEDCAQSHGATYQD